MFGFQLSAIKMTDMAITPKHGELNTTVIARLEGKSSLVEILQYNELRGSEDIRGAQNLFFAQQVGLRLKQARITLRDSDAIIEAGGLHFMHGNINLDNQYDRLRTQSLAALVQPQASMGQRRS